MRKMFFPLTLIILAALVMAACTGAPGTTGTQPTSQIPSTGGTAAAGGTTGAETPSAVSTTSPTSGAMTGGATGVATGEATGMATGTTAATTTSGGAASGSLTATDTVAVPTSNSATSGSTGVNPTAESGSANGATTSTPGVGPVTGGTTGTGVTTGTPAAGATSGTNTGMTTGTATTGGTTSGATTDTPAAGATSGTNAGTTTGTPMASATTGSATSGGATSGGITPSTPAATLSGPVPSAGSQTQGLYVRMSELLNASVNAQSSAQVGRVDGLMLERPLVAGVETTGTPNAPTATPVPMTGNQGVFVRYLMVNVSGAQAQSGSTSGSGNEVMVPWGAVATSAAGAVTLNVSSSAFASAPRVSMLDVVSGSNAWASPAVAYWSGQGLSIPNTGSTTTGNATGSSLVFIPRERGGINITDEKDTVLGSVSDLLINPTSGEVVYAVFEGGQTFGNRVFVLPMRSLIWAASSAGATVADRGAFHFNFNSDLLKNAPSLNSLNQLQVSPALINQLNAFWNSAIQALPVVTTTPAPK